MAEELQGDSRDRECRTRRARTLGQLCTLAVSDQESNALQAGHRPAELGFPRS